jgi:hypothetical protein
MKFRTTQRFVLAKDVRATLVRTAPHVELETHTLSAGTVISDWSSSPLDTVEGEVTSHGFLASKDNGETWYRYKSIDRIVTTVNPVKKSVATDFLDGAVQYFLPETAKVATK